jgi:hypothetical protein
MSSAPVRVRPGSSEQFPHAWGYWAGAILILAGIVVATVMIVSGVTGFVSDVQDFRREASDGSLETALARGAEIFIYDEDGFDGGPFDVKVTRVSDDVEVATSVVQDGTTYDVDGRLGTARVAFNVPTSDIYRVEVDTSLGDVASFAVGGNVGNDRTSSILRGIVVGSVLALLGFLGIVLTAILHARWRLRDAVLDQVAAARSVVSDTLGRNPAEGPADGASGAARRTTLWAQQRVDDARTRLDSATGGSGGTNPVWRESLATEARDRLGQADELLAAVEPAVTEAAAGSDVPRDLADRIDEALGRVQSRIESGDALRDIASDERVEAQEAARELAQQGRQVGEQASERIQGAQQAIVDQAAGEFDALRSDLGDISTNALADIATQASDAGDDLATGLAATAAATAGAAASAVTGLGRDLAETPPAAEFAPMSTLPPPPASRLAAPAPARTVEPEVQPVAETNDEAPAEPEPLMPPAGLDAFSALRPPPSRTILAPPPNAVPVALPNVVEPDVVEPDVVGPDVDDPEVDEAGPDTPSRGGFSLAPPPTYRSL